MLPEQHEALNTIITKMRVGRMTRRTFVERALTLGVASSMIVPLLEACGRGNVLLYWTHEHDASTTYKDLVDSYNRGQGQQDGIFVYPINGRSDSSRQYDDIENDLRAGTAKDILSLDIIWLPEFYTWLEPITEQWPLSERAKYFPGPLAGCTFDGQLYAAPFRINVGLLYYRTDIGATPPATWEDLAIRAKDFHASRKSRFGYVWQGAQYEGLVCNFVEVLYGYGGSLFTSPSPTNPRQVSVNSPAGLQALTEMVNWIDTGASPRDVLSYKEEDTRAVWQNRYAAYARHWPNLYGLSSGRDEEQLDSSQVVNAFDFCPLPPGGSNTVGHACIGGWQLGINKESAHRDEAWTFIHYMLGRQQQQFAALNGSFTVTLKSVYDDTHVSANNSLYKKPYLKSILQNAVSRPASPKYPGKTGISAAIQNRVYQALSKTASPQKALSDLQSDLQGILSRR